MDQTVPPRALKDINRWPLWLTIAVNFSVFYVVAQADSILESGWRGLITGAISFLPVGLALVVTSIANGQLSPEMKSRLVFLRWQHSLPGHRAFSVYGPKDPRVDMIAVKRMIGNKLPTSPKAQNRAWFSLYKEVESDSAVKQAHREFLFARDYAGFAFLFLLGFSPAAAMIVESWRVSLLYFVVLLLQFLIVRRAAAIYGIGFVTTVLARAKKVFARTPRRRRTAKG